MSHIVTYDLKSPGQNYEKLYKALESYGTYYHLQESVWIIVSTQKCKEIRDHLMSFTDSNDSLFVAKLTGEAAWTGLSDNNWLQNNL